MHILYAIPGLGVDHRLYSELLLKNAELRVLKWNSPKRFESLASYALRLAEQIDTSKKFSLLGVSFGGMCAVEIAKVHAPGKLVLVSSAKTRSELPWLIRAAKFFPLHRLINDAAMARLAVKNKWLFGVKDGGQAELFYDMLRSNPPQYFKDTISAIASWSNKSYPSSILHLHGGRDRLIPVSNIREAKTIKDGTHFMIMNSAAEVSKIIDEHLASANQQEI